MSTDANEVFYMGALWQKMGRSRLGGCGAAVVLFAVLAGDAPRLRAAQQSGQASAETLRMGSLRRVIASLEAGLDVYRLALAELVPAGKLVEEAGQGADGLPDAPLPAPAREVYARLADSVANRVPADALPAIARAYHAEIVDALATLARAPNISGVLRPHRRLVQALIGILTMADLVVDVFSRQRPVMMQVSTPETAFRSVNEALEELSEAEVNLVTQKQQAASFGAQLQAFLRLEAALGHALDLIAFAEEAGVHLGFELQLSTIGFQELVGVVRQRVNTLASLSVTFEKPPAPPSGALQVDLVESDKAGLVGPRAVAKLRWSAAKADAQAAALRIYRHTAKEAARVAIERALLCDGAAPADAGQRADQASAQWSEDEQLVAVIAPGRSSFEEALDQMPIAPPMYRVAGVTAFGVEQVGLEAAAVYVPRGGEGATRVRATHQVLSPSDPAFYRDHDAVTVTWELSRNDLTMQPHRERLRADVALPWVEKYLIYRLTGEQRIAVGAVPAGTTQFVDRPGVDQLQQGVRYVVAAQMAGARPGRTPAELACARSELVQVDLFEALHWAQVGAALLRHPTRFERRVAAELEVDAARLAALQQAFTGKAADTRELLAQSWWRSVAMEQKMAWLEQWPQLFAPESRERWINDGVQQLTQRDRTMLQAEVWLAQYPGFEAEVERWWQLLDEAAKQQARDAWSATLDRLYWQEWQARLAQADAVQQRALQRALRVWTWWTSRDAPEQKKLAQWWQELDPNLVRERTAAWFGALSPAAQLAVRWPDWRQLTPAEQQDRLDGAYRALPDRLLPLFLAYVAWWEDTSGGTQAAALLRDVGRLHSWWNRLRYSVRPLDQRLSFHLPAVLGFGAFLLVVAGMAWWLRRVWARRRQQPRVA